MKATGEVQVIPIGAGVFVRRRIHETLHAEGTVRIATFVKIGTRTDKEPSQAAKLF